jgi:hypothetical protein
MRSEFLAINWRDFFKGLILAVITAVITTVYELLQTGTLFQSESLKQIGLVALGAFLAYIIKNFFDNSKGEFLTPERK